jgi:hypothetical protein
VQRIRRAGGVSYSARPPLSREQMDLIMKDERPAAEIAVAFKVPRVVVEQMKDVLFGKKR